MAATERVVLPATFELKPHRALAGFTIDYDASKDPRRVCALYVRIDGYAHELVLEAMRGSLVCSHFVPAGGTSVVDISPKPISGDVTASVGTVAAIYGAQPLPPTTSFLQGARDEPVIYIDYGDCDGAKLEFELTVDTCNERPALHSLIALSFSANGPEVGTYPALTSVFVNDNFEITLNLCAPLSDSELFLVVENDRTQRIRLVDAPQLTVADVRFLGYGDKT